MNKNIIDQLQKCKIAIQYSPDDTEVYIPRQSNVQARTDYFVIRQEYDININKSLVFPCDWYYTIHNNWNEGRGPVDENMHIQVTSIMGKMVQVSGIGKSNGSFWTGWLPISNLRIIGV